MSSDPKLGESLAAVIRSRRSSRDYRPEPVDRSEILDAALNLFASVGETSFSIRKLAASVGVDPMTAIRAATYWPSVAMKVDTQVGTVTPGKYADIIAVRGDVMRYIALLQRVDIVIKHGTRYK